MREPPMRAHHVPQTHMCIYIYYTQKSERLPNKEIRTQPSCCLQQGIHDDGAVLVLAFNGCFPVDFLHAPWKDRKKKLRCHQTWLAGRSARNKHNICVYILYIYLFIFIYMWIMQNRGLKIGNHLQYLNLCSVGIFHCQEVWHFSHPSCFFSEKREPWKIHWLICSLADPPVN